MPLLTTDFKEPSEHPYGMLAGVVPHHTSETEAFLAGLLSRCIEAGVWTAMKTKDNEDWLIEPGLLEKVREQTYRLTVKAKGLLYSQYGK